MSRRILLAITLLTSGCQTAPPERLIVCPRLYQYSKADEAAWEAEKDATPVGSWFRKITDDYIATRDEIRLCQGVH